MKNRTTQDVNTTQPRKVTAIFRQIWNQLFTIESHKIRLNAPPNQFNLVSKVTYKRKIAQKHPGSASAERKSENASFSAVNYSVNFVLSSGNTNNTSML
jgi:hypothetical protein